MADERVRSDKRRPGGTSRSGRSRTDTRSSRARKDTRTSDPAARTRTKPHLRKPSRVQGPGKSVPSRLRLASSTHRLRVLGIAMAVMLTIFIGRDFQLQVFDSTAFARTAAEKMTVTKELSALRGQIFDRNGVVLATTEPAVSIYANDNLIRTDGKGAGVTLTASQQDKAEQAPEAIAGLLSKYLGKPASTYLALLTKAGAGAGNVLIAANVSTGVYDQLNQELSDGGWFGLSKVDTPIRVYPAPGVASNVVGFLNAQGVGAGGLEYSLNSSLAGTPGKEMYQASTFGRIPLADQTLVPAVNGTSYTLTIDSELQSTAQNILAAGVTRAAAKAGIMIVMNVKTGEVLARADCPSFDSNDISHASASALGNRAVTDAYEPGSVEKVLTMAALTDAGLVTPSSRVAVPAKIKSGDGYIQDSFGHGTMYFTARGVIANSSNIGTALFTRTMAKPTLANYLRSFGLGSTTGIGLPGEATGYVPSGNMADYTRDQIAFGQGVSVTAIQEASAIAGIVNGGIYNSPTILKSAVSGDGKSVGVPATQTRRVISANASAMVRNMMEAVTSLVKARAISGYRWIGKTGTAQKYVNGVQVGYTASFVGVAPAENPQILVYTVLDEPLDGHQGSSVALPLAKEMMELALPRYGVLPSTTKAPDDPLQYTP